jgi:hypothetical protein
MGDLVEERGSGRSAMWFWRETVAAIADSVTRDLREHWLLAVRAIIAGWALHLTWAFVMNVLLGGGQQLWRMHISFFVLTWLVLPVTVGWGVARTHRAKPAAMVLAYSASLAMFGIWDMIVTTSQMKSFQWDDFALYCLFVPLTLAGGLLARPRPRIS